MAATPTTRATRKSAQVAWVTLSDPAESGDPRGIRTGDQALLDLGEIEGLPIRSPREAWGRIAAGE